MAECGCLDPTKKAVVGEVLNTYLQVIEDSMMKKNIEIIKKEIEDCSCKVSKKSDKTDGEKKEKEKREPSEYNKHTSSCMKSGKSMKDCAIEWQDKKKK